LEANEFTPPATQALRVLNFTMIQRAAGVHVANISHFALSSSYPRSLAIERV
jgi:hypothetical protein